MEKDTMSKENQKNYELKSDAVEKLLKAEKGEVPEFSQEELNKYRSGKTKWRFPQWLKVLGIKTWFYGAVCFFVFWGLGMYLVDQWDLYFVAAIVLGMVTDLLINHFLRFTEKLPGGNARWMLITRRGAMGFGLNLMYGFLLMFLVVTVYNAINSGIFAITGGDPNTRLLSVEPIGFGLIATGADMLCVALKRTFMKIVADAQKK